MKAGPWNVSRLRGLLCGVTQSPSLSDNQKLATLLPGQELTVYLNGPQVIISGVQTAANVTQANIVASKVMHPLAPVTKHRLSTNFVVVAAQNDAGWLRHDHAGFCCNVCLSLFLFWLGGLVFSTLSVLLGALPLQLFQV